MPVHGNGKFILCVGIPTTTIRKQMDLQLWVKVWLVKMLKWFLMIVPLAVKSISCADSETVDMMTRNLTWLELDGTFNSENNYQ